MKNQTTVIGGFGNKTTINESWTGPKELYSRSDTFQSNPLQKTSLIISHTSAVGDMVKPNPFSYTIHKTEMLSGQTVTISRSPALATSGPRSMVTTLDDGLTGEGANGSSINSNLLIDLSYNEMITRLYEQMRGSVDLSVSVAESGQVNRMFRAASKLSRYVRKWNWKEISSTWLEFTYGWKPLAQDLYGSIEQIRNKVGGSQTITASASKRELKKTRTEAGYYIDEINDMFSARTRASFTWTPTNRYLDQASRLTSLNPVSIAWELMPYSFVVDWFVDIGGYLRNLETSLTSVGVVGTGYITRTTLSEVTRRKIGRGRHLTLPNNGVSITGVLNSRIRSITLRRSLLTSLPIPGRPRFDANLGASRLISAAALLANFVKGEREPSIKMRRLTEAKFQRTRTRLKRSSPQRWEHVREVSK